MIGRLGKLRLGALGGGAVSINMTRLPQYLAPSGVAIIDDFELSSAFTAVNCTATTNTQDFVSGAASVKLTGTSGVTAQINKISSLHLSSAQAFRIWAYNHGSALDISNLQLYLSQSNFTNFYVAVKYPTISGWQSFVIKRAEFSAGGSPSWSNTFDRFRCNIVPSSGVQPIVSLDRLEALPEITMPAVMITFDDAYDTVYTAAYQYMRALGITATVYQITDNIGASGYLTDAHLHDLYGAGWDIASHTKTHANLTTLTQSQVEYELSASKAVLDSMGFVRSSNHAAYPYGAYNGTVLSAMTAAGFLTGRQVNGIRTTCPPGHNYTIPARNIGNTTSLSQAKAYIDSAISEGTIAPILFHNIVQGTASTDTEWSISDFAALMDYIVAKKIQPLTVSQFYALQSGAISVKKLW